VRVHEGEAGQRQHAQLRWDHKLPDDGVTVRLPGAGGMTARRRSITLIPPPLQQAPVAPKIPLAAAPWPAADGTQDHASHCERTASAYSRRLEPECRVCGDKCVRRICRRHVRRSVPSTDAKRVQSPAVDDDDHLITKYCECHAQDTCALHCTAQRGMGQLRRGNRRPEQQQAAWGCKNSGNVAQCTVRIPNAAAVMPG